MSRARQCCGREARFRCKVAAAGSLLSRSRSLPPPAVMGSWEVVRPARPAIHLRLGGGVWKHVRSTHLLFVFESAVMMGLSSFFRRFFPFVSDEASDFALLIAAFAPLDAISSLGGELYAACLARG